jgi:hypothetical protein
MICHATVLSNTAQSHALSNYHLRFPKVDAPPIEAENKAEASCQGNIPNLSLYYSLCVRQLMEGGEWGGGLIFGRVIVAVLA